MNDIETFVQKLEDAQLRPQINLDRPIYIQPEDSICYRASRIVIICGILDTKNGLSKQVISCVDFLLRNSAYQKRFIIEYFKGNKILLSKLKQYNPPNNLDLDQNLVPYKSVPWDLRFNDMFLYLYSRKLVEFKGSRNNLRIFLTADGQSYFNKILGIFDDSTNFLDLFGKKINETKTKKIITEILPKNFWRENEKLNYQ